MDKVYNKENKEALVASEASLSFIIHRPTSGVVEGPRICADIFDDDLR